jgi:orotate phosphoribosyltransferase
MDGERFLAQLERIGALKRGHFLLASGRHSDQYVEKFDLLRQPEVTEAACAALVEELGDDAAVDVVVGPTTGGIILAFEIARQLGLPAAYAERLNDGANERAFKRGTTFAPGTTALVVDDILTTGGSVRETLRALEAREVMTQAVAVLVNRSGGAVHFGLPLYSLARLEIASWAADECPLCAVGTPLSKPGTTAVP